MAGSPPIVLEHLLTSISYHREPGAVKRQKVPSGAIGCHLFGFSSFLKFKYDPSIVPDPFLFFSWKKSPAGFPGGSVVIF